MKRTRGMTLLEVLIATTILASLTVIVSTLWAQTKQWTEETATHDSALRLQRSLNMIDRQWESRLLDQALVGGEEGAVRVDESRLDFITTESVLFQDWPIVKVAYFAQQATQPDSATPSWRLVYEEIRLGTAADPASVPADPLSAADATNIRRSTLVDLIDRPVWSAVLTDAQIAEWESGLGVTPIDEPTPGDQRWINLTDNTDRKWAGLETATNPEAIRLDGVTAEGGFRWALVGQPLR